MQAERDHLRNFVFPELEERLRARRHHLEWVDLRLGVATAAHADEGARELQVLKVCLAEVRRCRPFLIALIGDRYGWIPPADRIAAAAAEEGFRSDITGRSVTDLEIEFGVLSDPEQRPLSFVYLREPLPYAEMAPEVAALHADAWDRDPDAADRVTRLAALKLRTETMLPGRVRRYAVGWDRERQRVTGLEAWGRSVVEDIWTALAAQTADATADADVSWQQAERNALDDFAEDRARDFVGRGPALRHVMACAFSPVAEDAAWGSCVTGESGSGKSAVFGELYRRCKGADAFVLAHASGASVRSGSVDVMLRRWIAELAAALGVGAGLADVAGSDAVEATFASLLNQMAARRRVLVLVDGLDQFETTARGRFVTWMPRMWPANARFIATAIPCEASTALSRRTGIESIDLPPLDEDEARRIVGAICARYHRVFETDVIDALVAKVGATGPALGNPLWLVLATEELNLVDADDYERVAHSYRGTAAERLRALMLDIVAALPSDIAGLYGAAFDHAEKLFGTVLAHTFLAVIGISRAGWRESDFRALLPKLTGEPWDELRIASLRRLFRGQIRRHAELGQWNFSHAQMRDAVRRRMALRRIPVPTLHGWVADHLLALDADDPLRQSETMVHLLGSEDWTRAARHYGGSSLSDADVEGATRALADAVLTAPAGNASAAARRLIRLLDAADVDQLTTETQARRFQDLLMPSLEGRAQVDARAMLADRIKEAFGALQRANPSVNRLNHDLSSAQMRMAGLRKERGDLKGAQAAFWDAVQVAQRLVSQEPRNPLWLRQLGIAHAGRGDVLAQAGDLTAAEPCYHAAAATAARLLEFDPDDLAVQRELAVYQSSLSDLLKARGDLTGAEALQRAAQDIVGVLAATRHGDTVLQRELAVSHAKLAELREVRGDLAGADASRRSGLVIMERLAAQDPGNAALQRDLATLHTTAGDVQFAQATLEGAGGGAAEASFREAFAIVERLAKRDPHDAEAQRNLGLAHGNIGKLQLARGERAAAEASARAWVAIGERVARQDFGNPGRQRDLAAGHLFLGDVLLEQGDLAAADASFRSVLAIMQRLADQAGASGGWQRDLSLAHDRIAAVLRRQGNLADAEASHRASLAIVEGLAARDPANAGWQRDLALAHSAIGELQQARGHLTPAAMSLGRAVAIVEGLGERDRANTNWSRILASLQDQLGDVHVRRGDFPAAEASFSIVVALKKRLAGDARENDADQQDLCIRYLKLGSVQRENNERVASASSYQAALAIAERLARRAPGNAELQRGLALCREELASVQAAGRGDTR